MWSQSAPQGPAVPQLLRGTQHLSSAPLNWDPPDNESQEGVTSPSAALLFSAISAHLSTCWDGHSGILWPSSGGSFSAQHWSGLFGHSWRGGIQPRAQAAQPDLPLPAERMNGPWRKTAKGNPLGGPFPEQDCITLPSYDLDWECLFSPVLFSPSLKHFKQLLQNSR